MYVIIFFSYLEDVYPERGRELFGCLCFVYVNKLFRRCIPRKGTRTAMFDARVFNIPKDLEDVYPERGR